MDTPEHTIFKLEKKHLAEIHATTNESLSADLRDCEAGVEAFLGSKMEKAMQIMDRKYGYTLYHTFGKAVLQALQCVFTLDAGDIAVAQQALKIVVEIASLLRKEQEWSLFGKKNPMKSMNRIQKHAEMVYAEAYLLKALIFLVTDPNMVGFVREGLAIRQSYGMFKQAYKFLASVPISEQEANGIDSHLVTSVYFGMGSFNLLLGTVPQKLLRIFEMIGFGGHRQFGLECLELGAGWPRNPHVKKSDKKCAVFIDKPILTCGTRKFMCELTLLMYHIFMASLIQIPNCNLVTARVMTDKALEMFPDSFVYLFFKGKSLQLDCTPDEAFVVFESVIKVQNEWKQFAHVCYWEMGMSCLAMGDWKKAVFSC